jgi:hypothetical protein
MYATIGGFWWTSTLSVTLAASAGSLDPASGLVGVVSFEVQAVNNIANTIKKDIM